MITQILCRKIGRKPRGTATAMRLCKFRKLCAIDSSGRKSRWSVKQACCFHPFVVSALTKILSSYVRHVRTSAPDVFHPSISYIHHGPRSQRDRCSRLGLPRPLVHCILLCRRIQLVRCTLLDLRSWRVSYSLLDQRRWWVSCNLHVLRPLLLFGWGWCEKKQIGNNKKMGCFRWMKQMDGLLWIDDSTFQRLAENFSEKESRQIDRYEIGNRKDNR